MYESLSWDVRVKLSRFDFLTGKYIFQQSEHQKFEHFPHPAAHAGLEIIFLKTYDKMYDGTVLTVCLDLPYFPC